MVLNVYGAVGKVVITAIQQSTNKHARVNDEEESYQMDTVQAMFFFLASKSGKTKMVPQVPPGLWEKVNDLFEMQ